MERIICLIIGYAFGLIQTSYIYGRIIGIDIREHGSGSAGATNALRTLGVKAGLITFFGDCFKCIAAVLLIRLFFQKDHADIIKLLVLYGATGTILGHNFPFYLKFKGGKGIAATAGLVLSFNWIMTILGIFTFFTTFLTTHYVSLGSLFVYIGFMIELVVLGQTGVLGMSQASLYELYCVGGFLTLLAFYRHKDNIKRLLAGTENKTYLKKKKEGNS